MSKYREENYDEVHGQILDNMREEHEKWDDIKNESPYSDQKDIARGVMERITKRAHKIRN